MLLEFENKILNTIGRNKNYNIDSKWCSFSDKLHLWFIKSIIQ